MQESRGWRVLVFRDMSFLVLGQRWQRTKQLFLWCQHGDILTQATQSALWTCGCMGTIKRSKNRHLVSVRRPRGRERLVFLQNLP